MFILKTTSKGVTMSVSHQNTVSKMDELIEARRHVQRLRAGLTAGVGHLDNPEALGGAHVKHRQDIRNLRGIMTDNEVIAFWQRESEAGHHFAADCILEWFAQ